MKCGVFTSSDGCSSAALDGAVHILGDNAAIRTSALSDSVDADSILEITAQRELYTQTFLYTKSLIDTSAASFLAYGEATTRPLVGRGTEAGEDTTAGADCVADRATGATAAANIESSDLKRYIASYYRSYLTSWGSGSRTFIAGKCRNVTLIFHCHLVATSPDNASLIIAEDSHTQR